MATPPQPHQSIKQFSVTSTLYQLVQVSCYVVQYWLNKKGSPQFQLCVLSALSGAIPPVARQGSLPEIMQTTNPLAQPSTPGHVTISHQAPASLWRIPSSPTLPPHFSLARGGREAWGPSVRWVGCYRDPGEAGLLPRGKCCLKLLW